MVHIVEARRRLEGQPTSDLLSMPHNDLLEGAIALEEFIKVHLHLLAKYYNLGFLLFFLRNCVQLSMLKQVGAYWPYPHSMPFFFPPCFVFIKLDQHVK